MSAAHQQITAIRIHLDQMVDPELAERIGATADRAVEMRVLRLIGHLGNVINSLEEAVTQLEHVEALRAKGVGPTPSALTSGIVKKAKELLGKAAE